jgi:hypothetical protein
MRDTAGFARERHDDGRQRGIVILNEVKDSARFSARPAIQPHAAMIASSNGRGTQNYIFTETFKRFQTSHGE